MHPLEPCHVIPAEGSNCADDLPAVLQELGSSPNESEPAALHLDSDKHLIGQLANWERFRLHPPVLLMPLFPGCVLPGAMKLAHQCTDPQSLDFSLLTATPLPQTTLLFLPPTPQSLSARRQIWDVLFCSFEFNYLENKCFLLKNLLPDNHTAWKSDLAQWHS